ncbi:MAG: hypothetical protein GYA55_04175 [SAR324 cluster bacterium]|uniref:Uncharacterized protein n=1 Tax=SAR324 cluster bacterium TaxID=2024889 RepID=A0A7X9FR60_9DELT|nr:hypothetical protein [SAR324 cluster bacterium]
MKLSKLRVSQIEPRRYKPSSLFQLWGTPLLERTLPRDGGTYRALGLFRTDSINFSFEEASRRRVQREILGSPSLRHKVAH